MRREKTARPREQNRALVRAFETLLSYIVFLYTIYPIVARALGLAAFRPSASREQSYLAYNIVLNEINYVIIAN